MNRKQHKWAGFRAPKLRICTPDIIDHIVLHRRHSPPKTSSTDTIRSGRACQKPLLPASSPPKSDDQNSQKSFNNSQLGPGIQKCANPEITYFLFSFFKFHAFPTVRSTCQYRGCMNRPCCIEWNTCRSAKTMLYDFGRYSCYAFFSLLVLFVLVKSCQKENV